FFFFQAEDGIRDKLVTGVQTCALPILGDHRGVDAYDPSRAPMGMPMLHDWIMSSLTADMSDADAERMLGGLIAFAGKDNPVFNKLMRTSMLRDTWRTPRGREVARHIAFRDIPFVDLA